MFGIGIGIAATQFRNTGGVSPVVAAPVNTSAPVISGATPVGSALACSTGTWTGYPDPVFSYQWESDGTNVGSDQASYTTQPSDEGGAITCEVTATNSEGSATAVSNGLTVTAALAAPVNTAPPAIAGSASQGSTMTATGGVWSGNPVPGIAPNWQANGVDITGATGLTYDTVLGDVGKVITYRETATNSEGASVVSSNGITVTVASSAATVNSVAAGVFSGGAVPITVTATDASGGDDVYWVLVPSGDTAPTGSEVRAGQASGGGGPADSGDDTWPGPFSDTLVSGIARADYKVCVCIDNGYLSNVGVSNAVEVDTLAPVLLAAGGTENAGDIDWGVTSDEASGSIYAALRLSTNGVLSAANIINGTGNALDTDTDGSPTADAANAGTFTAPAPGTYVVDLVQQDSYGNQSSVVSSGAVTIAAAGHIVDEDFGTYADGDLSALANWDQALPRTIRVVSGDAVSTHSNQSGAVWAGAGSFAADFYAEIIDADPGGQFIGVLLFYQDTDNYYRVIYLPNGVLQFRARVSGSWQNITNAAAPITPSGSDIIRLAWEGGDMVVYHNGTEEIRITPTTSPTVGKIGFLARDDGDRIGSFIGDDL